MKGGRRGSHLCVGRGRGGGLRRCPDGSIRRTPGRLLGDGTQGGAPEARGWAVGGTGSSPGRSPETRLRGLASGIAAHGQKAAQEQVWTGRGSQPRPAVRSGGTAWRTQQRCGGQGEAPELARGSSHDPVGAALRQTGREERVPAPGVVGGGGSRGAGWFCFCFSRREEDSESLLLRGRSRAGSSLGLRPPRVPRPRRVPSW